MDKHDPWARRLFPRGLSRPFLLSSPFQKNSVLHPTIEAGYPKLTSWLCIYLYTRFSLRRGGRLACWLGLVVCGIFSPIALGGDACLTGMQECKSRVGKRKEEDY